MKTAFYEVCAVGLDGQRLEVGHCLVASLSGVDGEDHALAAVDSHLLLAVEPFLVLVGCLHCRKKVLLGRLTERLGGLDGHVPGDAGHTLWVGHEARVHSSLHLLAGLGESRLGDGVVLLHELEDDHVADVGLDGVGSVF